MYKQIINKIKENKYLYFFSKLSVFLVIVIILDWAIGNKLNSLYFKQKYGVEYRTAYSIDSTTADLLIFGSSRSTHQYYPEVFEKGLNLSYYNVGRDGTSIFYHYAILKGVLKRYNPKIIILDFEVDEFVKSQESYDRLSCLLPYYKTHPEIRSVVLLKSPWEKLKLLSKIYPNNSSIITILAGNSEFYKEMASDIKGYLPLTNVWKKPLRTDVIQRKSEIDSNKVQAYESFIKDCVNSNIELYIISSPSFINRTIPNYSIKLGKEIAQKYNVSFLDYTTDSTFLNNPSYFSDVIHFNNEGAKVFSCIIVERINKVKEEKFLITDEKQLIPQAIK